MNLIKHLAYVCIGLWQFHRQLTNPFSGLVVIELEPELSSAEAKFVNRRNTGLTLDRLQHKRTLNSCPLTPNLWNGRDGWCNNLAKVVQSRRRLVQTRRRLVQIFKKGHGYHRSIVRYLNPATMHACIEGLNCRGFR